MRIQGMKTDAKQTEHLRKLLESFSTAMLVTRRSSDSLHARPMAVAGVDGSLNLWFVSGEDTVKIQEISHDTRASVICQKGDSTFLSLSGKASLVRDRSRIDELWKESFRVWFPDGKDDPNLILIEFRPERAEYWDPSGFSRIAYLWEAARAYVTGTTPEIDEDTHAVVNLR